MEHYKFMNTPLPYAYDALEPYIDALTLELHYGTLLQGYVDRLNAVLEKQPALQKMTLEQLIGGSCRLPEPTGTQVSRFAGGVYNHRLYFDGMNPAPNPWYACALTAAIGAAYGGEEAFKEKFSAAAMAVFGSGYAWLTTDRRGDLRIVTTANQETPLPMGLYPVMTIDVWEHAFYLQYHAARADYINGWFHLVDWQKANDRYLSGPHGLRN